MSDIAGWNLSPPGKPVDDEGRCPCDRRNQHQHERGDGEQDLPRGSVLPPERLYPEHSAAAGASRGDSGTIGVLHAQGSQALWPGSAAVLGESAERAGPALVAWQFA